jgi:hypothetical protein
MLKASKSGILIIKNVFPTAYKTRHVSIRNASRQLIYISKYSASFLGGGDSRTTHKSTYYGEK